MAKFKCVQCGDESAFKAGMSVCPKCQAEISSDDLIVLTESLNYDATIDTAQPMATMDAASHSEADDDDDFSVPGDATIDTAQPMATLDAASHSEADDDDDFSVAGDSKKTALASELGYEDLPEHMETLDKTVTGYATVAKGNASAIPPRTIGEADSGAEALAEMRDYQIVSELGQGSFGIVFRAIQVPLERNVAIKLLKPLPLPPSTEGDQTKEARNQAETKIKEEFLREAQFTGKLEHPNIVPIHDIGIASGGKRADRPFYVMKEIKGISWQEVLAEKTRDENIDIFNNVVDAMGFSHSRNILHCDLKPENVMLGEFGEVLVVDWGQAVDMTRPETLRPGGTPAYCSPEMAKYWCDYCIDPEVAEKSKQLVGPQSDVYLLGAILFQIVTGHAPHFGLKGETPVDVMKRASRNEIRRFDDFAQDELMQIALRALRVSKEEEILTVAHLQFELKSYEERKQSIDIRDRAYELLEEARISTSYDTYQKAKFGFEESLELWKDNPTARQGLQQTRLNCAELALKDQNFDLGLGMLTQVETMQETQVKEKLQIGKRKRDRRKRLVYLLSAAFALAVFVGLVVNAWAIQVARDEQVKAQKATAKSVKAQADADAAIVIANQEKEIARVAKLEAADAKIEASDAKAEAVQAKTEADDARALAATSKAEAQAAQQAASTANQAAMLARTEADKYSEQVEGLKSDITKLNRDTTEAIAQKVQALKDVEIAEEASRLLRYKTRVTSIEQKVDSGDFNAARVSLDAETDKSTFEWGRLNLLSHPEVTLNSLFPEETVHEAQLSGDRSKLALRFDDRIEIRNTNDVLQPLFSIPGTNFERSALSQDGRTLAIGVAESDGKRRAIRIYDVATQTAIGNQLPAQSVSIDDLEFSRDGRFLLSVGTPSEIYRSVAQQHELMTWKNENGRWVEMSSPRFWGYRPNPTRATFSDDGNRIVTSSPDADPKQRFAYVLQLNDRENQSYFEWIGPDRAGTDSLESLKGVEDLGPAGVLKSGFVTSVFGDEQGTTVISSFVSDSGDANQIVVWNVDDSDNMVPVSLPAGVRGDDSSDELYPTFDPARTASVNAKINDLDFNGQVLLGAGDGDDKKMLYVWDLTDGDWSGLRNNPLVYNGHGQKIDAVGILQSGSKLISIAAGTEPEVLLTDRTTYQAERTELRVDDVKLTDDSSPYAFFRSSRTGQIIIGNDHGRVSLYDSANQVNPGLKWEVSAWDRHIITHRHMFALSRRDDLYRYDLESGELEAVLTGLSEIKSENRFDTRNRISSIEISDDSQFAVVQRKNRKRELEIWNLVDQSRQIIPFGGLQGLGVDELPLVKISSDGQWIAGGRIRFYVWKNDGTVVGNAGVENETKIPLSSLAFFKGTSQIVAGRSGVLSVYNDVETGFTNGPEAYFIENFPDAIGNPNIVDAIEHEDQAYVVIRRSGKTIPKSRLDLVRLDGNGSIEVLTSLEDVQQATLTPTGKLLASSLNAIAPTGGERNRPGIICYDLSTNQRLEPREVILSERNVAGRKTGVRGLFSRVFESPSNELILQWTTDNNQNTISVNESGALSNLCVIATPTVEAVGIMGDRALTFENGKVRFWNLRMEGANWTVSPGGSVPGNFEIFQISPDGTQAFAVSSDKDRFGIVDLNSGEYSADFSGSDLGKVTAASWTMDGQELALGLEDGKIAVWKTGSLNLNAAQLDDTVIDLLQYSGDGDSIVAIQNSRSSGQGVATVLRKPVDPLDQWVTSVRLSHSDQDSIGSADISADGNRVITGSRRGRVTLWNTMTQVESGNSDEVSERELLNVHRFPSMVRSVKFGPEESNVIAFEKASEEGVAFVFPTDK